MCPMSEGLTAADARRLLDALAGPWPLLDEQGAPLLDGGVCRACGGCLDSDRDPVVMHRADCVAVEQEFVWFEARAALDHASTDLARAVIRETERADRAEAEIGSAISRLVGLIGETAPLRDMIIALERGYMAACRERDEDCGPAASPNRVTGRESAAQEAWDRQAEILDGADLPSLTDVEG